MGALFTPPRTVYNGGVGGETSTQIKTRMLAYVPVNTAACIIWAGRNNFNDPTTVMADLASMVFYVGSSRYLIPSIINGNYALEVQGQSDYNLIVALNALIAAAYPNNYIDIRATLVAAYDTGNALDVINHAADQPPASLRAQTATGTLSGGINSSVTTFTTSTNTGAYSILLVDSEYILVTAASGTTVSTCTRGYGGTAAAAHSNGATYTVIDPLHLGAAGCAIVAAQCKAFATANGW